MSNEKQKKRQQWWLEMDSGGREEAYNNGVFLRSRNKSNGGCWDDVSTKRSAYARNQTNSLIVGEGGKDAWVSIDNVEHRGRVYIFLSWE